ncbi:hypothetical protein ACFO5X_21480 [Seohaeicola nanhaiensis]|uniref:Uncharacterized protein n=1 Tax=Seohaeicola nanhaiensis TaxID=1387282 RepID=A0ABV9KNB1_9RHOB
MTRLLCMIALLLPGLAQAQDDISASIASRGLAAVEADLAALPAPDATQRFALGGVRFLGAIEAALQLRWRLGLSGRTMDLPVLRLPVAENPTPEPFDPHFVETLAADLLARMEAAGTPLDTITDSDAVALRIDLADLWFDVNMNGARDTGEGVIEIAAGTVLPRRFNNDQTAAPVIRFDTADAAWLNAYTHMLSTAAELVLAYPPGDAVAEVGQAARAMQEVAGDAPPVNALAYMFEDEVDAVAALLLALRQEPKADHTRATRAHALETIRLNRLFWARLDAETDNESEWIPNARQTSALGIALPAEVATAWQAVLADAEDLLEGRKLIPYWRLKSGAGLNLKKLLEEPIPVDLVGWAQGKDLLPYAERGTRANAWNWREFTSLMRGESMLYVLLLN